VSFKSWRSYWDFSRSVNTKFRYILSSESQDFLDSLADTCQSRISTLKAGSLVWRAQTGFDLRPYYQEDPETQEEVHVDDFRCPYSSERMKPLTSGASDGRANPKGIPYLYVATDKETAMSEVRPWLRVTVSIATFKLQRNLKIIDFSVNHGENNHRFYFQEPSESEIIEAVLSDIDNAFSKPTEASDLKSDYVPTQIISEFIKSKGYDGIAYKSSLAAGHNIVLFDLDSADVYKRYIFEVVKIESSFKRVQEY
jgi:hypothetical protein